MTNAKTLKPLVQMMLDVSNGKGEFEKTDLETIRDKAALIPSVVAENFSQLSARQVVDMWDTAKQAGEAAGITIEVPKAVDAAVSRGRSAPGAFQSTVGGTRYTEITQRATDKTTPRDRY